MSTDAPAIAVLGTRWVERAGERGFRDWTVDGTPLRDRLTLPGETLCDGITFMTEEGRGSRVVLESLRALLGENVEMGGPWVQFADRRVGLLFCPSCGALDCGAVSAEVVVTDTTVEWKDIAFQIVVYVEAGTTEVTTFGDSPLTLRFDRASYEATVRQLIRECSSSS